MHRVWKDDKTDIINDDPKFGQHSLPQRKISMVVSGQYSFYGMAAQIEK